MQMNTIRKTLLSLFLIMCTAISFAQQKEITVSGTITDESKEPLIGVTVSVKNQPGLGVASDLNGNYKIKVGENETLIFSFIGFDTQEIAVREKSTINVMLQTTSSELETVTVVGSGVQRKVSVVGAITSVDVATLNAPTSNLSNNLAGNVAGVIAMQRSGEPGANFSDFWIRGISTFGASSSALVLVDGIERNFNEINVEDIESFSILKDASATAIYGQRGANGVIIITTKKGKEGKVNINFKAEYGLNTPSRKTKYVDALSYAGLANEAVASRSKTPGETYMYDPAELDIIQHNLDPDLYPNVDWYDALFNDVMNNYRAMVNISGGGSTARYFISGGYYNEEGMYKGSNLNNYNTNVSYERFNFRSNTDVNITKTTILELGVSGWITNQIKPGSSSADIWSSIPVVTSITAPIRYSNGYYPTIGHVGNEASPYVLMNESGYRTLWENKLETNIALKQNLSMITEGLDFTGKFSFDSYNYNEVNRAKWPDTYRAEVQRDGKGNLVFRRTGTSSPLNQSTSSWGDRRYYSELNLNYNRLFNDVHRVGGLLMYYQQEYFRNDAGNNFRSAVPKRNMALSGRTTYSYDDRYLLEFNFGYTGSENFEKGKRFGFFPAVAGGWVVSNESFLKDKKWMDQLKLRYSWGKVGNDVLDTRFPYITTIQNGGGYSFGDLGQYGQTGTYINVLGTPNLTWEVAKKNNLGIDIGLFNKLTITADIFKDQRSRIFMARNNIPPSVGLSGSQKPWANVGEMESKGMDGTVAYTQKLDKVTLTLRGNLTYSYSKILERDEADNALPYQMQRGYRYGQTRGLIALGLFNDQHDIDNSPIHTFGTVQPGDIKYKDVNGDGIINDYDVVPLGSSSVPSVVYGTGLSVQWNGFDMNVLLQGSGNCDFFVSGAGVYPFANGASGNILQVVSDPSNRWISSEISGTIDTERQDVIFPRLTYGNNANNNRNSTWWLRNSRYLRLKNLEIGYTLPNKFTRKYLMENVRVYFLGNNLMVFDSFKWWDPELANNNGAAYPLQKNFTLGLTVNF